MQFKHHLGAEKVKCMQRRFLTTYNDLIHTELIILLSCPIPQPKAADRVGKTSCSSPSPEAGLILVTIRYSEEVGREGNTPSSTACLST